MPVIIPDDLPAKKQLQDENLFVMSSARAITQDIRPLKIIIFNLMPNKQQTETQLLRLIGNSPLQVEIVFLRTATYQSKNTSQSHLESFYTTFEQIEGFKFDGMIITGAPVEKMEFDRVDYWNELIKIMEWTKTHVFSTFHICWAAQAGLYYHYGIEKYPLSEKLSGVYKHRVINSDSPLVRGFDEVFYAPHSRYTDVNIAKIYENKNLKLLCVSKEAGAYLITDIHDRHVFCTGHSEYDTETLKDEYYRDLAISKDTRIPVNYFTNDDPGILPINTWRAHAHLLFANWLNYCVYQQTPYDIEVIGSEHTNNKGE